MEQWKLVIEYVKEFGNITPAKLTERKYKEGFFGSETPKRCRELLAKGLLHRKKDGKFKTFYPTEKFIKIYTREKIVLRPENQTIKYRQDSLFTTESKELNHYEI
ncbi:MAG TPA: hypothetical protein VIL99_14745 [Ignavibacteria bacterium]